MKTDYLKTPFQNTPDGADPSINMRELISPEIEANTDEGDEYLDDKIRVKDQPYEDEKLND
jgi:hypothetical protein